METRTIIVKFNANTTIETPSLNFGQTLAFTAVVSTTAMDETPNDNTSQLNQIVVNAAEIINKTCIEGISVSSSQVGEYVHYIIRFKNDGTTIAQNIVVKDNIDSTKFDITTLKPIDGSHSFETRISGIDKVEFIFQNINLSPSSPNNDCYVAFKIKTLPTLIIGEIFTNTASIYFDYKMPLDTNTESTTIQALSNQSFEPSNNFKVFPNPVKNKLNIGSPNSFTISTVSIYNTLGQLMQIISNPTTASFDVSELKTGIYFLHLTTQERTTTSIQFIKE